jgi:hypothetical protein
MLKMYKHKHKIDGDKNALIQDTLNKGLGTYLFKVSIGYM